MLQKRSSQFFRSIFDRMRRVRWVAVLVGVFLLGAGFSFLSPAFLTARNLGNIAIQSAITGVMAVGMTFVIMTAGIDISVGAIAYLTSALGAALVIQYQSPIIMYLIGIFLGILLGLINGLIINFLRINPLVTTLATLYIYRGLGIHANQAGITIVHQGARFFGIGSIAGVPMPLILPILIGIIGALILNYTRFGRYVLAIGNSQDAAHDSGLPVRQVLIAVYVVAGLCAGLGGLILAGRVGAVSSDQGVNIEFTVITASVLGGTNLYGGRGSILGSLIGAVLLVMIDDGLNLISASPYIYDTVRGAVLVGAVMIDRASTLRLFTTGFPFNVLAARHRSEAASQS
jgi:ribose transport system permease protein